MYMNVISTIQSIVTKRSEIDELIKSIDKVRLVETFSHILNKMINIDRNNYRYDYHGPSILIKKGIYTFEEYYYERGGEWMVCFTDDDGGQDLDLKLRYLSIENLCVLFTDLIQRDDVSYELNKDKFKQLNEGIDVGNILNKSKIILGKEDELRKLISELNEDDLIEVVENILNRTSENNSLIIDSDDIVYRHKNKNYTIDSFYNENGDGDNPHWLISMLDPPYNMHPIETEIYDLGVNPLLKILNVLLNNDKVSGLLNTKIFKEINESIIKFDSFTLNEDFDENDITIKNSNGSVISELIKVNKMQVDLSDLIKSIDIYKLHEVMHFLLDKICVRKSYSLPIDIIIDDKMIDSLIFKKERKSWDITFHPKNGSYKIHQKITTTKKEILIEIFNKLMSNPDVSYKLNIKAFKQINEGVESAPAETRLNIFKGDFNHLTKDQMGGMEIFAPRTNSEINRISSEIFSEEENDFDGMFDFDDPNNDSRDENGDIIDVENGYDNDDTGLVINKKDVISTPNRSYDYPYGMDNNPSPTFQLDNTTQSKSNIIFRFADYRGIGNFR